MIVYHFYDLRVENEEEAKIWTHLLQKSGKTESDKNASSATGVSRTKAAEEKAIYPFSLQIITT
jgi:hypothetical protein